MTDNDLMTFGQHKGEKMANVPPNYLVWLYRENEKDYKNNRIIDKKLKPVMDYIKDYGIENLEKEGDK